MAKDQDESLSEPEPDTYPQQNLRDLVGDDPHAKHVSRSASSASRQHSDAIRAGGGEMIDADSLAGGLMPSARLEDADGPDPIDERYKRRIAAIPQLVADDNFESHLASSVNERLEKFKNSGVNRAHSSHSSADGERISPSDEDEKPEVVTATGSKPRKRVNFRRNSVSSARSRTSRASIASKRSLEEKTQQVAHDLVNQHVKEDKTGKGFSVVSDGDVATSDETYKPDHPHISRAENLETGTDAIPEYGDGDNVGEDYLNEKKPTTGILGSLLRLYDSQGKPSATGSSTAVNSVHTSRSTTPLRHSPQGSPVVSPVGSPTLRPTHSPNLLERLEHAGKKLHRPQIYRSSSASDYKQHRAKGDHTPKGLGKLAISSLNAMAGTGQDIFSIEKNSKERKELKKKQQLKQRQIALQIADILHRQRFILRFARALMLYGAPSHRLEEFLYQTAATLEIDAAFVYFPGCVIVTFGDSSTHTSETIIIRVAQGLNLYKLDHAHRIYKHFVHAYIGLDAAAQQLDELLASKNPYPKWLLILFFALGDGFFGLLSFGGGWKELPIIIFLGLIVGTLQMWVAPKSTLYANVFEISSSIIVSFLGRALSSITRNGKHVFCFGAIVQGSIAMILPGYIILTGALEMQSKSLVSGSVRMFYAIIYSMFLTFGITLGSAIYGWMDHNASNDLDCNVLPDTKWKILFVPICACCLAMCNQAGPRQIPAMVIVACAGYTVLALLQYNISNASMFTSTLGALTIGIFGNLWSRLGHGLAFTTMVPGVLVIVPGGVAAQGALISGVDIANSIVNKTYNANDTTSSGSAAVTQFGGSMTQVAVGISVGLFLSTLAVYPLGVKSKSTGMFTF